MWPTLERSAIGDGNIYWDIHF